MSIFCSPLSNCLPDVLLSTVRKVIIRIKMVKNFEDYICQRISFLRCKGVGTKIDPTLCRADRMVDHVSSD